MDSDEPVLPSDGNIAYAALRLGELFTAAKLCRTHVLQKRRIPDLNSASVRLDQTAQDSRQKVDATIRKDD